MPKLEALNIGVNPLKILYTKVRNIAKLVLDRYNWPKLDIHVDTVLAYGRKIDFTILNYV